MLYLVCLQVNLGRLGHIGPLVVNSHERGLPERHFVVGARVQVNHDLQVCEQSH